MFTDALIPAVNDVFGPLANAENGDSTADITTKEELPTDPTHTLDHNYYFGYDFRADPLVVAKDLDKYIDHILELTGHEKVILRASSMGGVMTMAYFEQFGTEKIKSVIFQNCPISGTAVAGDLFCGRLDARILFLIGYVGQISPTKKIVARTVTLDDGSKCLCRTLFYLFILLCGNKALQILFGYSK